MAFIFKPKLGFEDRPCPRWGEKEDVEHVRNHIVNDGFCKNRNDYSGCHGVPFHHLQGYERQSRNKASMSPDAPDGSTRPFESDQSGRRFGPTGKRHVDPDPPLEMITRHSASRLDNYGENYLSTNTRSSINDTSRKLYRESRYQILYPGRSEQVKNTESSDTRITRFDNHINFSTKIHGNDLHQLSQRNENAHQKFLISMVYNYKLPPALHMPDDHWQEDYLSLLHPTQEEAETEVPVIRKFLRPTIPDKIRAFMDSAVTEMRFQNCDKTPEETISGYIVRDNAGPCVGEWENSPYQYKLKLPDKDVTQRRFHDTYRDQTPDLRDNIRSLRRCDFYGYRSSAFT